MNTIEHSDWRDFLEQWNTQAMAFLIRALRRNGIADSHQYGFGSALRLIAQGCDLKIPEALFQPLGEIGTDAEILAEAQRRIQEIESLITPAYRQRWADWDYFAEKYHWTVIRHGGHFFPPATEEAIATAEHRLGTALTPTYKDFLRVSNGWLTVSSRILPVEAIAWLRDKSPAWVEDFGTETDSDADQSMREHLVYGSQQYPPRYRRAYVKECLQISDRLAEINCVLLLNPALVFETGECEAWFLAAWLPGARRFQSFHAFMGLDESSGLA
jgi:hypothetical protein